MRRARRDLGIAVLLISAIHGGTLRSSSVQAPSLAAGGGHTYIERSGRFPCQGAYVTGSIFEVEPGQPFFEITGSLVDAGGKPLVGEVMTLWTLTAIDEGLLLTTPDKTNPESTTDSDGSFLLKTGAIYEDFNVVVGFDIHEPRTLCSIVPVMKDGQPLKIRLSGSSAVIDLGRVFVK